MRRAARVDENHAAVAELFRALGCEWESTATVGRGFPDGVVTWWPASRSMFDVKVALVEVKRPKAELRVGQARFRTRFPVWVVRDESDVKDCVQWLKKR